MACEKGSVKASCPGGSVDILGEIIIRKKHNNIVFLSQKGHEVR